MAVSYESAIAFLHSIRLKERPKTPSIPTSPGNFVLPRIPSLGGAPELRGKPSLVGMSEWLSQLGYSANSINNLNIIHVAGTKGKGSTCAFIESLLRTYGKRTGFPRKTGLYTSPHLIHPEERIRIDFKPLSKANFAKYLSEVREVLSQTSHKIGSDTPRYLQFLALTSFHAFIREKVDVVVLETHHGGEFDATNVIQKPVVTAITPIGEDHVVTLGPTIHNIAWHKAGIFKTGTPAFSTLQKPEIAKVLLDRANVKAVTLSFDRVSDDIPLIKPDVQRMNLSLARTVCNAFLQRTNGGSISPDDILQTAKKFVWPGRFQVINDDHCMWFIDGAHNKLSIEYAAQWFAESSYDHGEPRRLSPKRVLIFSQLSSDRDGAAILESLCYVLEQKQLSMDGVVFTSYTINQNKDPFHVDQRYFEIWKRFYPSSVIEVTPNVEDALRIAKEFRDEGDEIHVLVTGSLYLVGAALSLLQPTGVVS